MAEQLLINRDDFLKLTPLGGNVDVDKFLPFIKMAQDAHLQPILGTKLFNKIKTDAEAEALANEYKTLTDDYIKPFLVHYAMIDFLPFHAYTINNSGIQKHQSENMATIDASDLNTLIQLSRNKAEFYGRRMLDYLCKESSNLPEYGQTPDAGGMTPRGDQNFHSWVL